jgi:inhibitor of cysteine peptidase
VEDLVKRFLLLLIVLTTFLVAGCIQVETYSDEGQGIDTGVNQQFAIALGANPSTGYSWQASYDETMLELVEKTYKEEAKEGLVGAGGVEYFRFKALKIGRTQVTLTYKQPWEGGGVGETKVFAVHIR